MIFECRGPNVSSVPLVSWLVCTNVADEQLHKALNSCLEQTFCDFELIIVANGLDAEFIAQEVKVWVGHDCRVRVFSTEVRHLIFSLSLGLHFARGEFVARMDGDDISRSDRLARQIEYMKTHEDVVVLGTSYDLIDAVGVRLQTVRMPTTNAEIRRALLWSNPICHPSVMFRRRFVLDAGGYLGSFHAEDYDLWIRLAKIPTNHFANLEEVCLGYRDSSVGGARRSRYAYATAAAAQVRAFVEGQGLVWAISALLTTLKALTRSRAVRQKSE